MAPKTPRAGTRSSSRLSGKSPESAQSSPSVNGSAKKRKADASASPSNRSGKKPKPEQKTLEETVNAAPDKDEAKDAPDSKPEQEEIKDEPSHTKQEQDDKEPADSANQPAATEPTKEETDAPKASTDGAVEESSQREKALPSNVLEKGILYFFVRPRVGIDDPKTIQDLARSYLVMRPLPAGAKLSDGPIDDLENNRVIALPKKYLPKSHSDRFMAFVEKHSASIPALKEEFMASTTYQTQTAGERTTHPVTPIAEGVYAITTTGRESHLAYMLTIPSELGEVQNALGLADKGSFIISSKNPESKGPANTQLDAPAQFSKDIMDDFRGRSWMPTEPRHLDHEKCQILLIGEGQGSLGKAVEAQEKDEKSDEKNTPEEDMELLQHEDLKRVESLRGDDTVFDDLGISKKDYPQVPTTW